MNKPPLIQDVGIGLRAAHQQALLAEQPPSIRWLEVTTENYLGPKAIPCHHLEALRSLYPVTFHGIGLSLGGCDPLDLAYLKALKTLKARFEPAWVSDHLSWCRFDGQFVPDLLPLPYTDEAIQHVAQRIQQVQDFLGERILIENVSAYARYPESVYAEWEFVNAVAETADCYVLLDVNNVVVSAFNQGFSPQQYVQNLQLARVKQCHLAGYDDRGDYYFDTHSQPVHDKVWALYQQVMEQLPTVPTLIEWDHQIPPLGTLLKEVEKAYAITKLARTTAARLSSHHRETIPSDL